MSGGRFNYDQYTIDQIAEDIQTLIDNNGKEIPKSKRDMGRDFYEKYPEEGFYREYPPHIIEKFKEAVELLKKSYIYAHRIDWLLSGDDGEDSFISRLSSELIDHSEAFKEKE